jgi:quinol monooxygenase YgiN
MPKVTFIARMTVKVGREAEFLSLMAQLGDYVKASEPGTVQYEMFQLREPQRYAVLEGFVDEAAAGIHAGSAVLQELAPRISECLIGTWEIEHLDPV